jgi:CheY-like chemotaxis protein
MPATILVVDDDCDLRDGLCELFKDEGYQVASARNGREALKYLAANPLPCAILLDLMMPLMNGWDFLKHRQADARLAGVPVVVMSAMGGDAPANAIGAAAVLSKPLDLERVLNLVRTYCSSSN